MNYKKHYDNLIRRAKSRIISGVYLERHHIVPKCLGGSDSAINLVELTPEEHYVAHQLLVKMNPDHFGLAHAAVMMCKSKNGQRINNKLYGWLKIRSSKLRSEAMKGRKPSPLAISKLKENLIGVPLKPEHVEKIRKSKLGCRNPMYGTKKTPEEKKHLSEMVSKNRWTGEDISKQRDVSKSNWENENYRALMKRVHVGRKNTEETKSKMSHSAKAAWAKRKANFK